MSASKEDHDTLWNLYQKCIILNKIPEFELIVIPHTILWLIGHLQFMSGPCVCIVHINVFHITPFYSSVSETNLTIDMALNGRGALLKSKPVLQHFAKTCTVCVYSRCKAELKRWIVQDWMKNTDRLIRHLFFLPQSWKDIYKRINNIKRHQHPKWPPQYVRLSVNSMLIPWKWNAFIHWLNRVGRTDGAAWYSTECSLMQI